MADRVRRKRSTPRKPPNWHAVAQSQASAGDWQALLQTLADQLDSWGWPDLQRVARLSGRAELPQLVRDTQAMLYGAPNQQTAAADLAQRWTACLQAWPIEPLQDPQSGGPTGLYPD